jgi:hypothetical protein
MLNGKWQMAKTTAEGRKGKRHFLTADLRGNARIRKEDKKFRPNPRSSA